MSLMYDNREVQEYRDTIRNLALFGADEVPTVRIDDIPAHFEKFQNTNDTWSELEIPNGFDACGCIYRFNEGSEGFWWHKHDVSERIIVVKGEIEIVLEINGIFEYKTVRANEFFFIEKGVRHKVQFKKPIVETQEIMVVWYPAFEVGWAGDF